MPAQPANPVNPTPPDGAQRHTVERLRRWELLEYGMFIHFGMITFDYWEAGDKPSSYYAPPVVDADQWIRTARDAGMTYAVLTAKTELGHCLWPSRHTDYHVGTSGNRTDVVEAFVRACEKYGLTAGLYYNPSDQHHWVQRIAAQDPAAVPHLTRVDETYFAFQQAQIEELLTQYGPIGEVWIDLPTVLGAEYRRRQYDQIAGLQPDAVIVMNNGRTDGSAFLPDKAWPSDVMTMERVLPASIRGHNPWFRIDGRDYYVPGEHCDTLGYEWQFIEGDNPRSTRELLAMRTICKERRVNFLLNVPPGRAGVIPGMHVESLEQLRRAWRGGQGVG